MIPLLWRGSLSATKVPWILGVNYVPLIGDDAKNSSKNFARRSGAIVVVHRPRRSCNLMRGEGYKISMTRRTTVVLSKIMQRKVDKGPSGTLPEKGWVEVILPSFFAEDP
jgi:hypothetical protein